MHNQRVKTAVTFVFISVLLSVIAFVYYQYGGYSKSLNPQLIRENILEREFNANLPGRGWYDTGIWIKSGQTVFARTKNNPFILTIDGYRSHALLNDSNYFTAGISAYEEPTEFTDVALVKTQGKIYLFSDYPAEVYLKVYNDSGIVARLQNSKIQPEQTPVSAEQQSVKEAPTDNKSSSFWSWTIWIFTLILSSCIGLFASYHIIGHIVNKLGLYGKTGILAMVIFIVLGISVGLSLTWLINKSLLWIGLYS